MNCFFFWCFTYSDWEEKVRWHVENSILQILVSMLVQVEEKSHRYDVDFYTKNCVSGKQRRRIYFVESWRTCRRCRWNFNRSSRLCTSNGRFDLRKKIFILSKFVNSRTLLMVESYSKEILLIHWHIVVHFQLNSQESNKQTNRLKLFRLLIIVITISRCWCISMHCCVEIFGFEAIESNNKRKFFKYEFAFFYLPVFFAACST